MIYCRSLAYAKDWVVNKIKFQWWIKDMYRKIFRIKRHRVSKLSWNKISRLLIFNSWLSCIAWKMKLYTLFLLWLSTWNEIDSEVAFLFISVVCLFDLGCTGFFTGHSLLANTNERYYMKTSIFLEIINSCCMSIYLSLWKYRWMPDPKIKQTNNKDE